ncbi:MAG: hypothetical protein ABSG76_23130 [Xanthobacteraceae bacterium]
MDKKRQEAIERERREKSLELGLEDSMAASDPVAAVQPAPPVEEPDAAPVRLERHDASDIVQLSDGSRWRVWPGDVPATLQWLPSTEFLVSKVEDEHCSHVLINMLDKSRIRVIDAEKVWPIEDVRASFKAG